MSTDTRLPAFGLRPPVQVESLPLDDPLVQKQVERIARGSTPVREYVDGRFVAWIDTTRPASRSGQNDSTGVSGAAVRRDESARTGTPDAPRPGSPSRSVTPAGAG